MSNTFGGLTLDEIEEVMTGHRSIEPKSKKEATREQDGSKWIVDVKGSCGDDCWEISVLLKSNTHGAKSYGWMGVDKMMVGSSGGPCHDIVCDLVWDGLIKIADALCKNMNEDSQ